MASENQEDPINNNAGTDEETCVEQLISSPNGSPSASGSSTIGSAKSDYDFISRLPNEIIGIILSLLPTKVAASTSILSKRWKDLLSHVDNLSFDETMVQYPNEEEAASGALRFLEFVYKTVKTFTLLSNFPIKEISLCHVPRSEHVDEESRVYDLISTAMKRGLLELHLHAISHKTKFWLKVSKFFTSDTLVKLTLSGKYMFPVEDVSFPALKSLSLLSVTLISDPYYDRFLHGCPILEDFFVTDADEWTSPCYNVFLKSTSINRLVVLFNRPGPKKAFVFIIKAQSLVYLDYSSYVADIYLLVDLDLLVEVRLNLKLWDSTNAYDYYDYDEPNEDIFGNVTILVAGISNITMLHLSPDTLEVFHFCCESMPVFNNLLNLSIESNKDKGWQVMPLLLKSCPNLRTLIIKGLVHKVTSKCGDACACIPKKQKKRKKKKKKIEKEEQNCCLWTCQVKVLEISEYGGSSQELNQMRHFLGNLKCLETVKVSVDGNNNSKLLRDDLQALHRVSSKCNILFI